MIVGLLETTQLHQLERQHAHAQHQDQEKKRKENQIIVRWGISECGNLETVERLNRGALALMATWLQRR